MPLNKAGLKALGRGITDPAWLCFSWFGMTAGISLLESPARFTAEALSRTAALDLGRVVFALLNKVELAALVLLLILVRVSGNTRRFWGECAVLTLILLAQSTWLLPELSARAQQIVSGVEPSASIAHGAYAALELTKLATLLVLGFRALLLNRTMPSLSRP